MKDKDIIIKTIQTITIVLIYHISKNNNLFLFASTLSLYNVFSSCFSHITLKETLQKNDSYKNKNKIIRYTTINILIIYLIFILLSIFIGDAFNTALNVENTFLPYLMMGLSLITEPLLKIYLEYLNSYNKPKLSKNLLIVYYILESILLLIISIITLKIIKLPTYISISLFYLSKIISFITILIIIYLNLKKIKVDKIKEVQRVNYKKEVKNILTNNLHKSIIKVIKNSYYYISIILLYSVLSNRYNYDLELIEKNITFIYLYGLSIINLIIKVILSSKEKKEDTNIIEYIYNSFENTLITSIIIGITSPLICKILFLTNENNIYFTMLSILSIFIVLYKVTFEYTKNNKIIYISLLTGIISKLILTIPLINSFYRMGYNLVYGDIISTIISLSLSSIINYIYIKLNNKTEKTFEKILKTMYESILLCIVLLILQFIIPIKTNNYILALLILMFYITVSIICIRLKKKRG